MDLSSELAYEGDNVVDDWDDGMFGEIERSPCDVCYFNLDVKIVEETETHLYVQPLNRPAIWLAKIRLVVKRYPDGECTLVMPQWFALSLNLV